MNILLGSENVKTSSSWLTTRDGVSLHYFEVKPDQSNLNSDRPPVILIHGWGASALAFLGLARELGKKSFVTFVPDMRGHGFTAKTSVPTNEKKKSFLRAMVEDLDDFLIKKGIEKVIIIGFSMGGAVGQLYALKWPEKVDKLVLLSSSCRFKLPLYLKAVLYLPVPFVGVAKSQLPRYFPVFFKGLVEKNLVRYLADGFHRVNLLVFRESLKELKFFDIKERVNELSIPILLIAGTKDPIVNEQDMKFYTKFNQVKSVLYPGLSHLAFFEEWQTSTAILDTFLTGNEWRGDHSCLKKE
ncbi:MAG: alpha/beta fold hydrolase [Candidatus Odinarchaeota archaeon]